MLTPLAQESSRHNDYGASQRSHVTLSEHYIEWYVKVRKNQSEVAESSELYVTCMIAVYRFPFME